MCLITQQILGQASSRIRSWRAHVQTSGSLTWNIVSIECANVCWLSVAVVGTRKSRKGALFRGEGVGNLLSLRLWLLHTPNVLSPNNPDAMLIINHRLALLDADRPASSMGLLVSSMPMRVVCCLCLNCGRKKGHPDHACLQWRKLTNVVRFTERWRLRRCSISNEVCRRKGTVASGLSVSTNCSYSAFGHCRRKLLGSKCLAKNALSLPCTATRHGGTTVGSERG